MFLNVVEATALLFTLPNGATHIKFARRFVEFQVTF
jgi:hypothetical protein